MNSFVYKNPTQIYFGEGAIKNLYDQLNNYGKNVLLAYGRGAIKKEGIYDSVIKILNECNKNIIEFSGIMPNPTVKKVREGISICRKNNIDFILAVGGGSTVDCCKAVAVGSLIEGDFWDELYTKRVLAQEAIPLGVVLTMVGTASEMNSAAVITNEDIKVKGAFYSPATFPRFSILDPIYTYSVPKYQMVSGICDIMSHLMEQYFSGTEDNVSDDINEAIMKSVVKNARIAVKNPMDYTARSNLMWSATLALNGIVGCGKTQDWEVHQIEHQLAAYYDIAHGMGLAAVTPSYLRFIYKDGLNKFRKFAVNVWGINEKGKTDEQLALQGIDCLEAFFKEIGAATSLRELNIFEKSKLSEIANSCNIRKGGYRILTHEDINNILNQCF